MTFGSVVGVSGGEYRKESARRVYKEEEEKQK